MGVGAREGGAGEAREEVVGEGDCGVQEDGVAGPGVGLCEAEDGP